MSGVTGAIVGGALVTAGASAWSADQASDAASGAARTGTAENSRQFDTIRADTAPQRELGRGATGLLGRLYGLPVQSDSQRAASAPRLVGDVYLPAETELVSTDGGRNRNYDVYLDGKRIGALGPGGQSGKFINDTGVDIHQLIRSRAPAAGAASAGNATTGPDMSAFIESPDFQFNLEQTNRATDKSLLSRGRGLSGAAVKEAQRNASGLASGEFSNFFNRLTTLAGLGSAATNTSAQAGLTTASNNANIITNAGNTRASAYTDAAAGVNNAVTGGLSNYVLLQQLNKPQTMGLYGGYNTGMYNGSGLRVA